MSKKKYLHLLGAAVTAALCSVPMSFSGRVAAADETATASSYIPKFELAGITVEAKRPDWESKLSPGTVTVIRPAEYKGEQKDLPDLLKMVPGVHVREVNGKGQYTVVTVRGSTAAQVGVFVDGVMTNLGGDAAVDISTIPVKNVERIEVYRGYIPARFGGTFIGGVINVVTKKPTKANISAELGKASFGGKSASLEVVSPLASGSLLVGLNYEAAKGDFPYHNYSYDDPKNQRYVQSVLDEYPNVIESIENSLTLDNWNKSKIEDLYKRGNISENVRNQYIDNSGQIDSEGWLDFVRNGGLIQAEIEYVKEKARDTSGISQEWNDNLKSYVSQNDDFLKSAGNWYISEYEKDPKFKNEFITQYKGYLKRIKQYEDKYGKDSEEFKERKANLDKKMKKVFRNNLISAIGDSWEERNDPNGYFMNNPDAKKQIDNKIYEEVDKKAAAKIDSIKNVANVTKNELDPETSVEYDARKNDLYSYKLTLEGYKRLAKEKAERHRKYNDRKNISSLIKWQNDNWMVKASYNHINRHLPDSTWGLESVAGNGHDIGIGTDTFDSVWADSKKQTLDTYDLMLQNRQQNGRLEWGWFVDYQHQKKKYRAENKLNYPWDEEGNFVNWGNSASDNFWMYSVLREWSEYTSNKYNLQMDGSYKLSDRQILEFQANYSYEKLNIDGSNMADVLKNFTEESFGLWTSWQIRNQFEQKILNLQVQDTITLDKKATWFLTPSWRFNSSTIIGHSDSPNFYKKPDGSSQAFRWFHPRDSQRDRKGTWQLALKKNVNDNLTFRMTGGTYFRLLNMYEIAGDGAGILPMPTDTWEKASFPRPEYGKQFDFSTLWNGKLLKSDAYATMTYFWRDTNRMLQLRRKSKDFWCYTNDSRGKVHGIELQSGLKWKHVSLDLDATYMNIKAEQKIDAHIPGGNGRWFSTHATYLPKWEGSLRLSYFPSPKFTVFGEVHYTDAIYTDSDTTPSLTGIDLGYPNPSITVVNAGIKLKPNKSWQLTFGCNDIFNRNPKMKISIGDGLYVNPQYPLQGRTYYASIRYEF